MNRKNRLQSDGHFSLSDVIRALKFCYPKILGDSICVVCPYNEYKNCENKMIRDAIFYLDWMNKEYNRMEKENNEN